MLAKEYRHTTKQFMAVFSRGTRTQGRVVTICYVPQETCTCSVVVSKKIYKKAVDRNRCRRQVYAVVARLLEQTARVGAYVLIVKPHVGSLTNDEFTTALQNDLVLALRVKVQ